MLCSNIIVRSMYVGNQPSLTVQTLSHGGNCEGSSNIMDILSLDGCTSTYSMVILWYSGGYRLHSIYLKIW